MKKQCLGVAAEAATLGVGSGQRADRGRWFEVQPLGQDLLDRAVVGRAEVVGPPAGVFQQFIAVLLCKPQQALDSTQLDQNSIAEQHAYQGGTGRTDALGLAQAPLDIVQLPSLCLGWQMVGDGTAAPGAP